LMSGLSGSYDKATNLLTFSDPNASVTYHVATADGTMDATENTVGADDAAALKAGSPEDRVGTFVSNDIAYTFKVVSIDIANGVTTVTATPSPELQAILSA